MKQLALDVERDDDQLSIEEEREREVARDFGMLDQNGDLLPPRSEAT